MFQISNPLFFPSGKNRPNIIWGGAKYPLDPFRMAGYTSYMRVLWNFPSNQHGDAPALRPGGSHTLTRSRGRRYADRIRDDLP